MIHECSVLPWDYSSMQNFTRIAKEVETRDVRGVMDANELSGINVVRSFMLWRIILLQVLKLIN